MRRHLLVKQVANRAWVYSAHENMDEAVRNCLVQARSSDGTPTVWFVLTTERTLTVGDDLSPMEC